MILTFFFKTFSYLSTNIGLEELRVNYLKDIEKIDNRIEILKLRIQDEIEGKSVVTSDTEFDNPYVDPRYEDHNYSSKRVKTEQPKPVKPKPNVSGFYKGSYMVDTYAASRNEELQRERTERQIKLQKQHSKILRSNNDTSNAISALNESLQTKRESLIISEMNQKEEDALTDPIRAGFDLFDAPINYKESIHSSKYHGDDYDREKDPAFDTYSHLYMAMRYLPKQFLTDQIGTTKVYRVSSLIREISVRKDFFNYSNFILVGVIVSKREPTIASNGRSKILRMEITDFTYSIPLILQEEAFKKYWGVQPGSIVAILNPELKDKFHKRGNKFVHSANDVNLKIVNDSSMIEYARSRDYGICIDSKCNTYTNTAKSRYCDYHKEINSNKTASKRMEMGSNYKLFAPVDSNGNKEVVVMTTKQIENMELLNLYKENENRRSNGLAIENINTNPPLNKSETTGPMIITDFSNPVTISNTKTEEEKSRKHFSSVKASQAFRISNVVNKDALKKQEHFKIIDRQLKKKKMMKDPRFLMLHEKSVKASEVQKRKEKHALELKRELLKASKAEKSLRKDKATVEALKKERQDAQIHIKEYRDRKSKIPVNDDIDITTRFHNEGREVELSSDSDDNESY